MTQQLYLSHAAAQRRAAAETNLPNKRAMHERAAARWEEMADNLQETARRAQINERAKNASA